MSKITMLRLPDHIAKKISLLSKNKGIPFATVCTEIICEHINKTIKDKKGNI